MNGPLEQRFLSQARRASQDYPPPRNSSGQTSLRKPALRCLGAEIAEPGIQRVSRLHPAAAPWSNCMKAAAGSSRGGLWYRVIGQTVAKGLPFSNRAGKLA